MFGAIAAVNETAINSVGMVNDTVIGVRALTTIFKNEMLSQVKVHEATRRAIEEAEGIKLDEPA